MKKVLSKSKFAIASCAIAALVLVGCATVPQQTRLENRVKIVAQLGAGEALFEHPEWRVHFEQAAADLKILEATDTISIAQIVAVIERLPVKELHTARARLYIATGILLLEEAGVPYEISGNPAVQIKGVCRALRTGIEGAVLIAFPQ